MEKNKKPQYDIFISYRHTGAEDLSRNICDRLKSQGYTVFRDVESLNSGDFDEALYDYIDECNDFILVLPPNGLDRCKNENDWVRREIRRALEKKRNIIPVMMPGFVMSAADDLPEDIAKLSTKNGIEITNAYFDAAYNKLLKFLHSAPSDSEIGEPIADVSNDNQEVLDDISFYKLFDIHESIRDIDQIFLDSCRRKSDPVISLSAPVGYDTNNNKFCLDLLSMPHLFVFGLTGSGKTNLLQTFILSMAMNYSCDFVRFLFIDFKGGILREAVSDNDQNSIPHIYDECLLLSEVSKQIEALKKELKNRQIMFRNAETKLGYSIYTIQAYQAFYHQKKIEVPCPHLFIVVDECSPLDKNQILELLNIGRIGRSFGLHIIISTNDLNSINYLSERNGGYSTICMTKGLMSNRKMREIVKELTGRQVTSDLPTGTFLFINDSVTSAIQCKCANAEAEICDDINKNIFVKIEKEKRKKLEVLPSKYSHLTDSLSLRKIDRPMTQNRCIVNLLLNDPGVLIQKIFPQYTNIQHCDKSICNMYKAFDHQNNTDIAIKLYDKFYNDASRIAAFTDERLFQNLKSIKSNNVCPLIDRQLSEAPCLIMKYIEGDNLKVRLEKATLCDSFISFVPAVNFMLGILNGLKALHDKDIYYGDLNPSNIMVDKNNVPWLCDFSETNFNGSRLAGRTILLAGYISPDKAQGTIDYRSDIYEFGLILFDFLHFIRSYDDNVNEILFEIVKKCTRFNRDERYQSVDEIIYLLNGLLEKW